MKQGKLRVSLCLLLFAASSVASVAPLPRPTALAPDVEFWRRVYT
jgi:hypothetical protein